MQFPPITIIFLPLSRCANAHLEQINYNITLFHLLRNNILIQFDLLTGVNNSVLEYTTYQVPVSLTLSDLGGAAEDEGEFSFEMAFIGKGTVVTSA